MHKHIYNELNDITVHTTGSAINVVFQTSYYDISIFKNQPQCVVPLSITKALPIDYLVGDPVVP